MSTTTTADDAGVRSATLQRLRSTVEQVAQASEQLDTALGARDQAIRAALDAGASPTMLAGATGVSRVRIYQIRDSTR